MSYWLVMAVALIAVIAVLIATEAMEDEEPVRDDTERHPVWVALGTNGSQLTAPGDTRARNWLELTQQSLPDEVIAYDFTRSGATVDQVQRDGLPAALAAHPDIVSLFLGPDDFRDAESLPVFERRLWHVLSSLTRNGATVILPSLPELMHLPSLAAEDDADALGAERQSWNVTIARLSAAVGADVIDLDAEREMAAEAFFAEASGRFILTAAGHEWFAALMAASIQRWLTIEDRRDSEKG